MDVLFKIENIDLFTQVLEDILKNLYDFNHISAHTIIDTYSISKVKEEIKNIILETNLNTNEIAQLLSIKNINESDKIRKFISVLEENKSRLLYLSLVNYYCEFGETINTFDWKLKLICGSSELKTLSYSLLQLALYTITVNHKPAEKLYEMNKDMVLQLLTTLEEFVGKDAVN